MLQNNRFGNNLANYRNDIPIIDTSVTSDQYFRLFNVPDKLYVGKNSFRMRANMDALVKGSNIYVDIVDSTGKIIYHEFADFIGKDKSRLIVAHIYENTAPGEATIYIAGRTKVDMRNGRQIPYQTNNANSTTHIDYPNIMWIGKVVVVPNEQNNDEVFYITPPIVTTYERKEYYNKLVNPAERIKTLAGVGSQSISLQSVTQGNTYSNTSRYSTKFDENTKQVDLDPKQSGGGVQSNFQSIPLYRELSIIKANGFEFNSDMIGGKITVSGLNELLNIGYDVPPYEFNIVDIVDKTSAKISPNFKLVTKDANGEKVIDKFSNATEFIISYYSSDVELTSVASESFIQLDIKNLEPAAGNVDSVKISYKPYGSFGSDIDIGTFKINEQNYLVDPSTIIATKNDLVEFPIGDVRNATEFNTYWDLIELKNAVTVDSASIFDKGIQIEHSGVGPEPLNEYDYYFKVKDDYSIQSITDTEYKLQFSIKFGDKVLVDIPQQVDIYISGSSVISDVQKDKLVNPAQRKNEYGQFIGTVSNQGTSKLIDSKVYFKTLDDEQIVPVFMSKNSETIEVKNIIIAPRNELGFTPNMAKLILPVNNFKTDTELTINVDYLTGTNKKADQNTKVYGLQFTGSNAIQNEIDKVKEELETQILIISGSVSDIDLTPLEDAIDDLEDDVYIINNNISIIEGDITNIEGDITTINNDILTITNDITVIFGDIVDINTEIGDIYTEIDTINDLITDIYDDYVPITREIEINGVSYDLSADRSWTIDIDNIYNTDGEIETDRLVYSDLYQITFDTGAFLVGGVIGGNGRLHLWNSPNGAYGYIEQGDGFMDFRNDPALQLFNVDQSGNFYLYNYAGNYANISTSLISTSRTYQLPDADGTIFLKPMGGTGQYVDGTGALQTSVYGTVTSFSAGDLSPLFTTTESTATSTPALTFALSNAAGNTYFGRLTSTGTPSYISAGALTKTDDTNVTLTLGGSHATALLAAMSITVVWSGTLAVSRGGSGAGTFTAGYLKANGTSAFTTVGTIPYSDISGTPTIPVALWADKRVAFGKTATGGLDYDSNFIYDYTTSSFTIGSRLAGVEGQYSANIGIANIITSDYSIAIGTDNDLNGGIVSAFGSENIGTGVNVNVFGNLNSFTGNYVNIFGVSNIADASVSNLFGYGLNTNGFSGNAMFSDATGGSVAIAQDAFTAQFAGGYRFRLDASSTAVNISSTGIVNISNVPSLSSSVNLITRTLTGDLEQRTIDSLGITPILWDDTHIAFGDSSVHGLNHSRGFRYDYGTGTFFLGNGTGTGDSAANIGKNNNTDSVWSIVSGFNNLIDARSDMSSAFGDTNTIERSVVSSAHGYNIYINSTDHTHAIGSYFDSNGAGAGIVFLGDSQNDLFYATSKNSFFSRFRDGHYWYAGTSSLAMAITGSQNLYLGYVNKNNLEDQLLVWNVSTNEVEYRTASSLPFGTGTVTDVNSGAGMDFTNFTTSGTIILGTPSTITLASTNAATGTTHSHALNLGGSAGQYLAGDNTLQTFPTIPTYTAGTGIDLTGNVITNTLPSKWNQVGGLVMPVTADVITTKYGGGEGYLRLYKGDSTWSAFAAFHNPAHVRIGYIGFQTGYMNYTVEIGNHRFNGGSVQLGTIPSAPSATALLVDDGTGVISTRTVASLGIPTYTAGTGISIASNIITNTLPSKWTDTGSYIVPTVNRPIRTNNGASEGFANLYTGDTSFAGYLGIFETSGNRIGYIGYQTSFMNYTVQIGNHRFYGGSVYVDIIPSAPSATNLLVSDSGTVSTRTVASLPFTNNTGTVTDVNSGAGMDFTNFTTSGTIILGAGSDITLASTNSVSGTTHAHKLDLGGSAGQYLAGDNTLQTFPTIPTYTAGTGISIASNIITNTLPSKWTLVGDYLQPNSDYDISTKYVSGTNGFVKLERGTAASSGYISFYPPTGSRIGYIGYATGNMTYSAETGYHKFSGNHVRIDSVAQDEAITKVATFAANNEIKYRTISANVNKDSKSITVPVPAGGGEYYTLFHTETAITVTSLVCVVAGSSPSIDYVLRYAATRTGTATDIDTSTITVTSTTGTTNTSLENAAVPAGSWIFLRLLNKTGDVTEFHMTINYTK